VLKKVADDPSSRAWMSSIRNAQKDRNRAKAMGADMQSTDQLNSEWTDDGLSDTFLVCIYNVSIDQPYTILKASTGSTAADIISQALVKARRPESHRELALIEELEYYSDANAGSGDSGGAGSSGGPSKKKSGAVWRRVLGDEESVYLVQANWKTKGKFELKLRKDINSADMSDTSHRSDTAGSAAYNVQKLLQRNRHSLKRLTHFHRSSSKTRLEKYLIHSQTPVGPGASGVGVGTGSHPPSVRDSPNRQTHSEGEMPSDDDSSADTKAAKTLHLLTKKLSFRRLKVWK